MNDKTMVGVGLVVGALVLLVTMEVPLLPVLLLMFIVGVGGWFIGDAPIPDEVVLTARGEAGKSVVTIFVYDELEEAAEARGQSPLEFVTEAILRRLQQASGVTTDDLGKCFNEALRELDFNVKTEGE